jgi:hypothetical protein
MLNEAFSSLLLLTKRPMTLERKGVHSAINTFASTSNYSRNLGIVEDVVTKGREFIVDKDDLTANYSPPKRGDILVDATLGRMVLTEIREMTGIGGEILGYRIRVE